LSNVGELARFILGSHMVLAKVKQLSPVPPSAIYNFNRIEYKFKEHKREHHPKIKKKKKKKKIPPPKFNL